MTHYGLVAVGVERERFAPLTCSDTVRGQAIISTCGVSLLHLASAYAFSRSC